MPLDHDMVKPPKDFLDLIVKLKVGLVVVMVIKKVRLHCVHVYVLWVK